jgi:hypothetical protein
MQGATRTVGIIVGSIKAEWRQLHARYFGTIERFDGDAEQISNQIVERCWNDDYYMTSIGHFTQFFVRDFGTVAESLVKIGQKQRVIHTLRWALLNYRRAGVVTTCIDKKGHCFNAPMHAVDSLPWLLHCIVVSNYDLNIAERNFLEHQLVLYRKKYLDTSGHLRPMKFAEMRDAVVYDRSAYAVALVGRLAYCVERLGLRHFPHPLQKYQEELITRYWNGQYFNADRMTDAFSAECALMPFFLGVIIDNALFDATSQYIIDDEHDDPCGLIYTKQESAFHYHWWMSAPFMPHYEGESLWSWHGLFYLHTLRRYADKSFMSQRQKFATHTIVAHKTFPEMLNSDGSWYYAPIYRGDPGMVWAALYVDLARFNEHVY